jgi:hypothetical protein
LSICARGDPNAEDLRKQVQTAARPFNPFDARLGNIDPALPAASSLFAAAGRARIHVARRARSFGAT